MRGKIYSANVAPPYGYCWSFYCCLSKKGVCRCSASCAAGVIESIWPVSPLSLQEHIHSPTLYPSLTPFYRHPFKNMDGFSFQYSPFSHPSRHLRLQTLQILSGMEHYSAIFQGLVSRSKLNGYTFDPDSFDSFSPTRALPFKSRLGMVPRKTRPQKSWK